MARPVKAGLDYFPLDVHLDDDIEMIEAKFGLEGFGVLIKLYQKIYNNGYFYMWTEKELLLFKKRVNVDINLINDIINDCLRWDIFNNKMFKKYQILTSAGIQKRYVEATKRRKEVSFIKEYLLIDVRNNLYPNNVNVNINSINECNNTQSKVKESKVKESKEYIKGIFDHFVSKNILNHKKLTKEFEKDIKRALAESTAEEVKGAIDHYATMYHDQLYEYCNYKWGIHEFLTRREGYKRFLDEGSKWQNYLKTKESKPKNKSPNTKPTSFVNFPQRTDWDFDELGKLEREYQEKMLTEQGTGNENITGSVLDQI